jgi:hypothetical protein
MALRAFFRVTALAAVGALAACATEPDWSQPDPTAQGQERASRWRSDGFPALAARQLEESARLAGDEHDVATEVHCLFEAAECWLLDGRPSVAEVDVDRAARAIPELPAGSSKLRAASFRLECARGDLAAVDGRLPEARTHYEQALDDAIHGERDLATMRLAILAEKQHDAKRARTLVNGLGDPSDPRLPELRKMLRADEQVARVSATPSKAPPRTPIETPAAPPLPGGPPILPRTAWGARRSRPNLDRMTGVWRITVHHTATRLASNSSREAADAIRTFQRQHQDEKGWADIGYHFVIDPSGRVWEGRPLVWQGAHAGNPELNTGNIGVALIGDFTVQQPTASQKKALFDLLESLCAKYKIDRSHVYTHQEIRPDPTECPGPALQRIVASWRRGGGTTTLSAP